MIAYWFSREDGTTTHQKTPAEIGRTDTCEGDIIPCENGLHGSPTPFDALQYAEGAMLWVVELSGEIEEHCKPVDKYAARSRTYLKKLDCTRICRTFAARQALKNIPANTPEIVMEYLTDEAKGIDRSDIRNAARNAAMDAAWGAAMDAAWGAAMGAAMGAARGAAWDVAWGAAKSEYNEMVYAAL